MLPMRIKGATHCFVQPREWDGKDGRCSDLFVRVEGNVYRSAWEPTPLELEVLKAGGSVVLITVGKQPPVMLAVEMPPKDLGAD
jgi:hypothetical protein